MRANKKGFTIVELLIVVVVIAILAAITIVSYDGVQARACDATYQSPKVAYVFARLESISEDEYMSSDGACPDIPWVAQMYNLYGMNYWVEVSLIKQH